MLSLYRSKEGIEIVVDVLARGANIVIRKHGQAHHEYLSFDQLKTFRDVLSEALKSARK